MKTKTRPNPDNEKTVGELLEVTRKNFDIIRELNRSEGYEMGID